LRNHPGLCKFKFSSILKTWMRFHLQVERQSGGS
jgi:hypothetical protein